MGARHRLLPLVLALCALPALARPAAAFVRSVTTTSTPGNPIYLKWPSSCETVTVYLNGFADMTSDEVAKSIAGAAAAWGPDQVTCPSTTSDAGNGHPYFQIIPQLSTGGAVPGVDPHQDSNNSIIFVTSASDWEKSSAPAEALAFTSVYREPDGRIVEADIYINATDPTLISWANLDPGAPPPKNGIVRFDLQTVMTHEFGHFLGLSHPCVVDGTSASGGDNGDAPKTGVPLCSAATPQNLQAVMYPIIDSESIAKRVLTADDAAGVCAIYLPAMDPHSCTENTPDDGCGCMTAGAGLESSAPSVLALALVVARRRRRR
jgi:hypothetical protein